MVRITGTGLMLWMALAAPVAAQPRGFVGIPDRGGPSPTVAAQTDGVELLREAGGHLSRVAAQVNPAVVHILSNHDSRAGEIIEETGSGVIMRSPKSSGLFVVTNRHVVAGAPLSKVDIHLSDGRILHPVKVLDDMATDLAVLMLRETDLTAAQWGDSDNLDIGHFVLAVGSPFGLSQSVTMGIISAKSRRSLSLGGPREVINQDFLQTDAAINPGNSGGPLLNLYGQVIGINTAIASQGGGNEGIGFSIPSNLVQFVVDELLEKGRVHRGYLGVKLDNEFKVSTATRLRLDRLRGARVVHVYSETPASMAGLRIDDVILNFDGINVEDESHLIHRVSLTPVNKTVRVVVFREGREVTLHVTLTERPTDPRNESPPARQPNRAFPSSYRSTKDGLKVVRIDPAVSLQLGDRHAGQGVLVVSAPAAASDDDLQLYDVVQEVARQPVTSVAEFADAVAAAPADAPLLLKVRRMVDGEAVERLVIWTRR